MTDPKATLLQLNQNLNILGEREAKFAGNAPLDLLNQIDDHTQAIDLTRQAITGEISEQEWEEALKPLLLAINNGQVVNIEAETYVAGDVKGDIVAGDKVTGDKIIAVTYEALPPAEIRTRADLGILLKNVETTWIKGVLEKSVHEAVLLDLGIEIRADAVDHPWQMVLEAPDQARQVLPPNKKIKEIFDEENRLLLILGEPGSGKTITLLQLARDLIAEVKQDPAFTQPLPVIFNLSTWTDIQQPLDDWLISELVSKYRIPKKVGRHWLEDRRILPLLDGLDEVKPENRVACVEQMNRLSVEHGLQGVAVCSRIKDYTALDVRLAFNGAIYLQPLTPGQIEEYFDRAGDRLASLRATIQRDEALYSLAQSPLMLNIMTLAYQDTSAEDLNDRALNTDEARLRHLFNTYIARMFKRRGGGAAYDDEKIRQYLVWLAQNMQRHNQEVFLIEALQPSWLQGRFWRWFYTLTSRIVGVLFLLMIGLLALFVFGSSIEEEVAVGDFLFLPILLVISGLCVAPILGLPLGFIDIWRFEWLEKRIVVKVPSPIWQAIIGVAILLVPFGLLCGPPGLFFGLPFALIFGLRGSKDGLNNDIRIAEALRWSWSRAKIGMISGGLIAWVGFSLLGFFLTGRLIGKFWDLEVLIFYGIDFFSFGLIGALFTGLRSEVTEAKTRPNQGLRLSVRNAVYVGLITFIIFTLVIGIFYGLAILPDLFRGTSAYWTLLDYFGELNRVLKAVFPRTTGLVGRLFSVFGVSLFFGLAAAFWFGGLDIIRHYTLRLILIIQGHTPRNYARFLDYANDLIFLQKVGGGYRFIHRLLLEHFAAMSIEADNLND